MYSSPRPFLPLEKFQQPRRRKMYIQKLVGRRRPRLLEYNTITSPPEITWDYGYKTIFSPVVLVAFCCPCWKEANLEMIQQGRWGTKDRATAFFLFLAEQSILVRSPPICWFGNAEAFGNLHRQNCSNPCQQYHSRNLGDFLPSNRRTSLRAVRP